MPRYILSLKRYLAELAALISVVGGLYAFWQKIGSINLHVFAVFSLLVVAIGLAFVVTATRNSPILDRDARQAKLPRYSWMSRIAAGSAIALIVTGLVVHYSKLNGSGDEQLVILIADFDGPDDVYGLTESLFDELRKLELADPRIRIESADTVIAAKDGSRLARRLGERASASLVIWGWYRRTDQKASVSVNYETFDDPCWVKPPPSSTFLAEAQDLSCFSVQSQAAAEARTIANITAAVLYHSREDYARAKPHFEAALAAGTSTSPLPDSLRAKLYHRLAYATWRAGNPSAALGLYATALSLNPVNYDAFAGRAEIHFQLGTYDQAIVAYNSAIALEPNNPELLRRRGLVRAKNGDFTNAFVDLNRSVRLAPRDAWGYHHRAEALLTQRRFQDAIAQYTLALALDDTINRICRACVLNGRGRAHVEAYDAGRGTAADLRAARRDFTRAMRADPTDPNARFNRALTYLHDHNTRKALRDFNAALRLDPSHAPARLERARILFYKRARAADALIDLDVAVREDPLSTDAYMMRGEVLVDLGFPEHARADFERVRMTSEDVHTRWRAAAWVSRLAFGANVGRSRTCGVGVERL